MKTLRHSVVVAIAAVTICFSTSQRASAQFYSIYANGLLLPTATLNVGAGIGLTRHFSLDFSLTLNPLKTQQFSTQLAMLQAGVRYWPREIQYGQFVGAHILGAIYDVGNDTFHTRGVAFGAGLSWGYNWIISKRFNVGVEIGAAICLMQDTRENYSTPQYEDHTIYHTTRWALLPSKMAVNFIYLF